MQSPQPLSKPSVYTVLAGGGGGGAREFNILEFIALIITQNIALLSQHIHSC